MNKLVARLGSVMLAGATALGFMAAAGPAQAVDIKMWTLTAEGNYQRFLDIAVPEYKKTHPDFNLVYENFPNEAYKTAIQVALTGSEPPDIL